MTMKKYTVGLMTAVLVFALMLVGCSSDEKKAAPAKRNTESMLVNEGKLTVAASQDFPPFESLEDGKPVGFSVDLMDALAKEMGLELNYLKSVKFDTIVPIIAAGGKADVGVSSITITTEREKEIDFTEPYINSNQSITVMKNSGYSEAVQLEGKKIGAQLGTTGYDWAVESIPGADVVAYDEVTAIFAAMQAGQLDAIIVDLPVAQSYVKDLYQEAHIILEIPTGEQYGIAVSKDNPELTKKLNDALAEIKSNGIYDEVYAKWFVAIPSTVS